MNWDAVGAISEILGTLLVLLTLLYLARQVAHGVTSSRSAQNMSLMEAYADFNTSIFTNPDVAALMAKLESNEKAETVAEAVRIRHIAYRYGDIIFAAETAYREGQITNAQFEAYRTDVTVFLDTYPGMKAKLIEAYERFPTIKEMRIWGGMLSSGEANKG
jgi:hypothetical protein